MPLNFTVVDDPRTAYRPRQVDGLTAYWNANRGQMVDYQTGGALADRVAAMRSQQGPNPNAYVYGDSYGQIQGVEEARQRAAEQRAMQLYAMQQAAAERAQARADLNARANAADRLRALSIGNQAANDAARNQLYAQNLKLTQAAEAGRNQRANAAMQNKFLLAQQKQAQDDQAYLQDLDSTGADLASNWSDALSRYNDLQSQLGEFEKGYQSSAAEIAPYVSTQRVSGTGFGYVATNPKDAEAAAIAERANQFAQAKRSAASTAKELAAVVKELDGLNSSMRQNGFQIDPRTGRIVNSELPQASWQIQSSFAQPQRQPMTEDQYLAQLPAAKPPSGIAKGNGRWVK
jgi:hypothetical protein